MQKAPATITDRKAAARMIRRQMLARGWKLADLARVAGLHIRHCSNLVCGNNRSSRGRAAIETALGGRYFSDEITNNTNTTN